MKIVRAMKKIARLKGEIKEIKSRMSTCLNTLVENEFTEDFKSLEDQLIAKTADMIHLKVNIMNANIHYHMFSTILQLGELKSEMDFLKELEPKIGAQESRFRENKAVYKSQMTLADRNAKIAVCQKKINSITDVLDDFNAKTDIEDDVVVQS